jgi:gluconate 2-dehydrogenase alpha chain
MQDGPRSLGEVPGMTRKLPKKDVVIIGFDWTGAIHELTDEGLHVIAIEAVSWTPAPTLW